ncbi:aminotransferase class I/II-fold pyridoxal phosphate-dependent enzyme [Glaciimonas sp. Gout2]|uniref:aminotransferase class I/II-fold pyridoxal phosphate-dependent enzyme n=1 Tax=unclassified Glaciimonas TaxID=2644401 RepID=UPI002B23AFED|nr:MULTISPECIES: aminotransferase class I/II-fold pyridoxal phosphate-dependent enzyme [unclassified Glaciimonas]MEB0012248.1 aminotransferase class I/II-fold pyridoxal phosphate-dependent enzyme [Glaciimonas sp. Cout2]MEB0082431.1 aminotransferase class I/II-fold pyridoxal phosphate-dependent enzyme [Glaciimonas sp. Gout2]
MKPDFESINVIGKNLFRNNAKMVAASEVGYRIAQEQNMIGIRVDASAGQNKLRDIATGKDFVNLCSCSYLGLNSHPAVLQGGIDALQSQGITGLAMAEYRIRLSVMEELEQELRDLFNGPVLPAISCSALTAGILPLLASGHLTDGEPMVMVFDKCAHFSMAFIKPIIADETLVLNCPHNDMMYLEEICKKYPRVAYICDGVYSVGGVADLAALLSLQERYGLFLYFDDSHSLSVEGNNGEGHIRSRLAALNDRTIIVASIAKAFGSTGGIAMLGSEKHFEFLYRAGPLGWSQSLRTAAIGTTLGSIKVHKSAELHTLQQQLTHNIALFDRQITTLQRGNGLNIKVVEVGDQGKAVHLSKALYDKGFYCSPVFFPIVGRDRAGVRLMLRGDLPAEIVQSFVDQLKDILRKMDVQH